MAVFEEVVFTWAEREYRLPPDQMLRVIARIEDIITLGDLHQARLPLAKLSIAYGIALRAAGAVVSDEEVYNGLFKDAGKELVQRASAAVLTLRHLMVPPEHWREKKAPAGGKPAGGEAAAAASSPTVTS